MSSLSATQADGYYVPPEYYESGQYKHKSRNQFQGSKGHNQFLEKGVCRFELPYDGFCKGCGAHVGKGTRFNAAKSEAGNYFTTKIYEFRMKCRICALQEFVIRTNPKERGFDYDEGIHRQVQEFDTKEAGTLGVVDTEYGNKIEEPKSGHSSLSRLETMASGQRKSMTEHDHLRAVIKANSKTFLDDAGSNAKLRASFRVDRRGRKQRLKKAASLGWKEGMELADETAEDVVASRSTCFGDGRQKEQQKFRKLKTSSIFSGARMRRKKASGRTSGSEINPDPVGSSPGSVATTAPEVVTSSRNVATTAPEFVTSSRKKQKVTIVPGCNSAKVSAAVASAKSDNASGHSALAALAAYDSDSDT